MVGSMFRCSLHWRIDCYPRFFFHAEFTSAKQKIKSVFVKLYHTRPTTEVLVSGLMLSLMGALVFGIASSGPVMCVSRLIIGLGCGIGFLFPFWKKKWFTTQESRCL